jgi:hypothetical protein
MSKEWIELTTEEKTPRLTVDPQPTHSPFIRWRGRLWLRTPVRWLTPWALLALALVGAGAIMLLRLVGRAR